MRKIAFFALILSFGIWGCSDDRLFPFKSGNEDVEDTSKPVFISIKGDSMNLAELKGKKFKYRGVQDNPLYGSKGTILYMPGINEMSFQDGKPLTGNVQVELIEIYKPGDMILYNKQTVSGGRILESGGQVYINVTSDGKPVNISRFSRTYSVFFPGKNRGLMDIFYGDETPTNGMNWINFGNPQCKEDCGIKSSVTYDSLENVKQGYQFYPVRFKWINCDRFYEYPGEKTKVDFVSKVPGMEKLITYIVFPDINSVINVFGDKSLEMPIGENIKIISYAITEKKEYYFFYKEYTTKKDNTIEIELKKTTLEDFKKLLDSL